MASVLVTGGGRSDIVPDGILGVLPQVFQDPFGSLQERRELVPQDPRGVGGCSEQRMEILR